jgi:hypothetical protein
VRLPVFLSMLLTSSMASVSVMPSSDEAGDPFPAVSVGGLFPFSCEGGGSIMTRRIIKYYKTRHVVF